MDFDWTRARAFLASAEEGSFSAAARVLGVSQPTVSRQVAALEQELGLVLFERIGRRLQLTAAGAALAPHVRGMQRSAVAFGLTADGQAETVAGPVSVSCSDVVAGELLAPAIASIVERFPALEIQLVTTNEVSDLTRREADIAVRHVRPEQAELVARRLPDRRAGLFGSPDYLATHGPFQSVDDLGRARLIGFDRAEVMVEAMASFGLSLPASCFSVGVASSLVQRELARRGVGLCFLMTEAGVRDAGLRPVLPEVHLPVALWLVCHRELRTTPRYRVVFDALVAELRAPGGGVPR